MGTAFAKLTVAAAAAVIVGQSASAQTASEVDGPALYLENCAVCHGTTGQGDGILAENFEPRPRNLFIGSFRFRSTASGDAPAAQDLFRTITNGIEGSYGRSMPAFDQFSQDELQALAEVVLDFTGFEDFGIPIDVPPRPETAQLELGEQLFSDLGCTQCHGDLGAGNGILAGTLVDDGYSPIRPANLQTGVFKGGNAPEDVWLRIHLGIEGTPMPSFGRNLSVEESWALVEYVLQLGGTN